MVSYGSGARSCPIHVLDRPKVHDELFLIVNGISVIANGKSIEAKLPDTLEGFLMAQGLSPRSVVVEHNGEAVVPSEFVTRQVAAGDRLEIVKIVAGG